MERLVDLHVASTPWSCARRRGPAGACAHPSSVTPQPNPPHGKHCFRLWIPTLEPWLEHPTPTLPYSETTMVIHGLKQLDGPDGLLDHSAGRR